MKIHEMPIRHVKWLDSSSGGGWKHVEDIDDEYVGTGICYTVGYVYREDQDSISLVQSVCSKVSDLEKLDQINCIMTIPKCAILEIRDFYSEES